MILNSFTEVIFTNKDYTYTFFFSAVVQTRVGRRRKPTTKNTLKSQET